MPYTKSSCYLVIASEKLISLVQKCQILTLSAEYLRFNVGQLEYPAQLSSGQIFQTYVSFSVLGWMHLRECLKTHSFANSKILITTIQLNLCCLSTFHYDSAPNSPELSLLKFLLLAYHHAQPFLATTLDFTSFFTMAFLGSHTFCTAGLWISLPFVIVYCNATYFH